MIKNYIKTAIRNLRKNKIFSFINVFGLAIGLACCMLIAAYVYNELSYDKYPENANRIYRVEINVTGNGNIETYTNVDVAVGEGMKNAFPDVKYFTRLLIGKENFIHYNDKQFKERLVFADSNFLQVFSIHFLE